MDFIGGGGAGSSAGGDRHEGSDDKQRKKRYHRHTAHQIQRLEATFQEYPHPDEKTRNLLSRELGLHPRQIKFWFQNRRTQMKAQHERADNSALRSENDRIRCENIAIREALKNIICPSCGGPPLSQDPYFDEQKLQIENAHLKEELDRLSSIAARYIGRPISQLPPVQPIHISSLDLSMASTFGPGQGLITGPSSLDLDLDLLPGSSSSGIMANLPFPPITFSDMDKSLMADTATNAMDELIRLLQSNAPLWMKSGDEREILNLEAYDNIIQGSNGNNNNCRLRNPNARIEASRDSGLVLMNGLALVDMIMDSNKYVELFPAIVSRAKTIEVISSGNQSGRLQLMYEELQVLSALVPTRQLVVLRSCQQIEQGLWVIVDVSYNTPHIESFSTSPSSCKAQRLPSGCLIQDMSNGYSKVTRLEHWEVEDNSPIHNLYGDLIHSGSAFGATRWISNLQRICERYARLITSENPSTTNEAGGVILSPEGKRSMMKLAQRMVNNFCSNINPPNGQRSCTTVSGSNEFEVRATLYKNTGHGQPNGVILSASATIWLPVPSQTVFGFLSDERTRPQWDVLSNQSPVQEIAHISSGSNPGNSISVLRAYDTTQNNMLILQERCIDSSGSLVIYSPIDLPAINLAMSGEDPSYIPLLSSGFTVSSDGNGSSGIINNSGNNDDNDNKASSGSLLTVVLQILVSNSPSARMTPESVNTVNGLIGNMIQQIKTALSLQ